jgi:hypothetical protein
VFFTVVAKPAEYIRATDALGFTTAQRSGRTSALPLQPVKDETSVGVSTSAVARRISELRDVPDDVLIELHDKAAVHTQVGTDYYLEKLRRRDQVRGHGVEPPARCRLVRPVDRQLRCGCGHRRACVDAAQRESPRRIL